MQGVCCYFFIFLILTNNIFLLIYIFMLYKIIKTYMYVGGVLLLFFNSYQ
jgi:hypothetical protein